MIMPKTYGASGMTLDQLKAQKDAHFAAGGTYQQVADWAAKNQVDIGEANADWAARTAQPAPPKLPVPTPATYTPVTRSVDPAMETIQGRMPGLLNSPLAQQASTQAKQGMNARGLLNSSMAEGASQDAMLKSALPIASADASTYTNVANLNQGYQNQAGQFNAGEQNKFQLPGVTAQAESGLITQRGNQDMALQTLRGNQQKELAQIEAGFKNQMQASDSAARYFSTLSTMMNETLNSSNMTVDQKQQVISKQLDLLKLYLPILGRLSGVDISAFLNF